MFRIAWLLTIQNLLPPLLFSRIYLFVLVLHHILTAPTKCFVDGFSLMVFFWGVGPLFSINGCKGGLAIALFPHNARCRIVKGGL